MIYRVTFQVRLGDVGDGADAHGLLFGRQARRGPFEFGLAPLLVLLRDGLAGAPGRFLEALALVHEFANIELR